MKRKASKVGSHIATVCAYVGFSTLFSLSGIAVARHWNSETLAVYMLIFGAISVWGLWRSVPLRKIGRKFFSPVKAKEKKSVRYKFGIRRKEKI